MREQLNCVGPISRNADRRKYLRFNQGVMQITVKRRGLMSELKKGERIEWHNFNRFGFAFASHTRFDICEDICVDIKTDKIHVPGLVAVIHNARRQEGKFRYGVQFYYGANAYMRSAEIVELLSEVEDSLK